MRDPIRKIIGYAFADFVHDPNATPLKGPTGISELLEIYSSLVQGFKFPMKKEHVNFVHRYILPLVKMPILHFRYQQFNVRSYLPCCLTINSVVAHGLQLVQGIVSRLLQTLGEQATIPCQRHCHILFSTLVRCVRLLPDARTYVCFEVLHPFVGLGSAIRSNRQC